MKKSTENVIGGSMLRLVGCCRALGLRNGFRYWRLQNKAIRDPFMALRWAYQIRHEFMALRWAYQIHHEAKLEAERGNKRTADLMECFADDILERNHQFHTPNADPRRGDDGTNLK